MDTNMMIYHNWATRPDDERFLSLEELHAFNEAKRRESRQIPVAVEHLRLVPTADNNIMLDSGGNREPKPLSNWAFGQLCQRASAPAGYLRRLPATLAAIPLQWSVEQADDRDGIVLERDSEIGALTSASYGRIWDAEVSGALLDNIDPDIWKVPAASYAANDHKLATTLYASDRDMFVALVDDEKPVEVPGRDGVDTLFRGFVVRNSEVGNATLELILFLYRTICDNRIIWGYNEQQHIKIKHTSGGPQRFVRDLRPRLSEYINSSTEHVVGVISAARNKEVGNTEKDALVWLKNRGFTKSEAQAAVEGAQREPGNARSVWNIVQGLTAHAHGIQHTDQRVALERRAGKLLRMAA